MPDYEVDKALWFDKHYEGGYLFRNALIIDFVPPKDEGNEWQSVRLARPRFQPGQQEHRAERPQGSQR